MLLAIFTRKGAAGTQILPADRDYALPEVRRIVNMYLQPGELPILCLLKNNRFQALITTRQIIQSTIDGEERVGLDEIRSL